MKKILFILSCSISLLAQNVFFEKALKQNQPVQLTTSESSELSPCFDNQKKRVFYSSDQFGNYDIFVKELAKDQNSRLTVDPNRQYYPQLLNGKLHYFSDAGNVHGQLVKQSVFTENGTKYSAPYGKTGSYFYLESELYCAVDSAGNGEFLLYRITGKKSPALISGLKGSSFGISEADHRIYYAGAPDSLGFNNLFQGILRNDSLINEEQLSFGAMQIGQISVAPDGKAVVYDRIDRDTNGDGIIGLGDNPLLYLYANENSTYGNIAVTAGEWQLTNGLDACTEPFFAADGTIYFVSMQKGNADIWKISAGGTIPRMSSDKEQLALAEYLYNRYFFTLANGSSSQWEIKDQLLNTLLAFKRVELNFGQGSDSIRIAARLKSAEIMVRLNDYEGAETAYRQLISRFKEDQIIQGTTEIRLKMLEIERKKISLSVDGYELDQYLTYFKQLLKKYEHNSSVQSAVALQLGMIYYQLKKYEIGRQYLSLVSAYDAKLYPEALFWQARISITNDEYRTAGSYLLTALKNSSQTANGEKYIKEYLHAALLQNSDTTRVLNELSADEELPLALRAYAVLQSANRLLTEDEDAALAEFDRLKKWFVKNPGIDYLKLLAAQGDKLLAEHYLAIKEVEAAIGVMEFAVKNYQGVYYNYYYALALRKLSDLYYLKARDFVEKQKHEQAFVSFLESFNFNQNNLPAIRGLIDSYFNSGRGSEAQTFFNTKLAEEPANPAYNYALGYIYSLEGIKPGIYDENLIELSSRYLNKSLELDSRLLYAYLSLSYNLEALHHKRNLDLAKEQQQGFLLKTLRYFTAPVKQLINWIAGSEEKVNDYADQSVALLQKGLALADSTNDREVYLKMVLNLANSYYNFGEYGRANALKYYTLLIDKKYEFSSESQQAMIYERIGHCYFTLNNAEAVKYYDLSAALYKKLNDRTSEIRVSLRSALFYLIKTDNEGDLIGGDDAATVYKNIIIKLESEGRFGQVKLLRRNIGYAYQVDLEPEQSENELDKVLELNAKSKRVKTKDDEYIIFSFFGLDIPIWKFNLQVGASNPDGFTSDEETALLYSLQAVNYATKKDFGDAENLLKKKYELFKEKDNRLGLSLISNRLGLNCYYRGDYAASAAYFKESREICRKLKLYRMSLFNQNNYLKALIGVHNQSAAVITAQDLQLNTDEVAKGENYELAVYHNLRAVLQELPENKTSQPNTVQAFRSFYSSLRNGLKAEKELLAADSLLNKTTNPGAQENKLLAAVKFNLAKIAGQNGDKESALLQLKSGMEAAKAGGDLTQSWRFKLAMAKESTDSKEKLELLKAAENELAAYLPEIETYELFTSWQADILPLYEELCTIYLAEKDYRQVIYYQERYKSRLLANYYSSRFFDLNQELHNIHIKKITDNNREIQLRSAELEKLILKNRPKDAARRQKLKEDIARYQSELTEIIAGIKKSEDSRLLQFVSTEASDPALWQKQLDDETAAVSYLTLGDSLHIFYLDNSTISHRAVKNSLGKADLKKLTATANAATPEYKNLRLQFYNQLFAPIADLAEDKSYLYIIPEWNWQLFVPFNLLNSGEGAYLGEEFSFSKLLSLKTLDLAKENLNINNQSVREVQIAAGADKNSRKKELETPAILHLAAPLSKNGNNALDNYFAFGTEKLQVKDLLQYKLAAYLAVLNGLAPSAEAEDCWILINSLIYGGMPTVLLPLNPQPGNDSLLNGFVKYAGSKLQSEKLDQLLVDYLRKEKLAPEAASRLMSVESFGLFTLSAKEQQQYAKDNLMNFVAKGSRFFNQKRYWQALYFYNSALQMALRSKDLPSEKNLLKLIGECYTGLNDFEQAVVTGRRLVQIYRTNSENSDLAAAYNKISRDFLRANQADSSETYQLKYLDLIKGKAAKQELAAYDLLSLIAARGGNFKQSNKYRLNYLSFAGLIEFDEGDLSILADKVNEQNASTLFSSLRNLMANYYQAAELDSAIEIYNLMEDNRPLFKAEPPKSWGKVYEAVGLCYFKKSFYKTAWEYYLKARKLFTDKEDLASINQNLADLFYKSNELQKAGIAINQTARYVDPDDIMRLMRLYNTESLIREKSGNYELARSRSYEAVEKALAGKNRFEESTARVNLAKILLTREPEKARTSLYLAKNLALATKNRAALTAADYYLALDQQNQGKSDSAKILWQISLANAQKYGDKIFEGRNLLSLGKFYAAQKQLDSAAIYLKKSKSLAEVYNFKDIYYSSLRELAGSAATEESQKLWQLLIDGLVEDVYFINDNSLDPEIARLAEESFTVLTDKSLSDKNYEAAFKLLQQQKQLQIRDEMNNRELLFGDTEVNSFANLLAKTKTKIKKLRSEYLASLLDKKTTAADSLNRLVDKSRLEYEKSFADLKSHRRLFGMSYRTAAQISRDLAADEAALIYLPGKIQANVLILTKDSIFSRLAGKNQEIEKLSAKFYKNLTAGLDISGVAADLYGELLKPVEDVISQKKRLLFYAGGVLTNLPFEVLSNGKNALIDNHDIGELVLEQLPQDKPVSETSALSLVNAFTPALDDLKFADKEAEMLKWNWNSTQIAASKEATEKLFASVDLKSFNLLHFATHAVINPKDSADSYIQLAADDRDDGKYTYSEILENRLNGQSVILSGCDTGGKNGSQYNSYTDLAQAFLLSGASSVVASRWRADDLTSAVVMKRYFRYLQAGKDKIAALSEAKRIVKTRLKSHPYYWAQFKVMEN